MTVAILPSSPSAHSANGGTSPLAAESAEGARFSDVLSRQGAAHHAPSSNPAAGRASQQGTDHKPHASRTQTRSADDGSAQDGTQDPSATIALPDLALQIATQAAAVIERASPSAARTAVTDPSQDDSANVLAGAHAALATALASGQPALSSAVDDPKAIAAPGKSAIRTPAATLLRKDALSAQASQTDSATGKTGTRSATTTLSANDPTLPADTALALQADGSQFHGGARAPQQAEITAPALLPAGTPAASAVAIGTASGQTVSTGAIALPLQHPQWPQALGQQVLQLGQAGRHAPQVAELRLDPPDLGPLRIAIQMTDNVAHAVFVSAHANVRNAIENALPQLQEQLAQAGISLGQASVNDQGSPNQAFQMATGGSARQAAGSADNGADEAISSLASAPQRTINSNALVDTFA